MIREFLFRAYLVAFVCSVFFVSLIGFEKGVFDAIQLALVTTLFWLIVGWVCAPLFKKK